MKHKFVLGIFSLSATLLHAMPALAEDKPADTPAADQPSATKVVGFGVFYAPEYPGARKNRVGPALFAEYHHPNGFFASSTSGLGYEKKIDNSDLSIALGFRGGRKEKSDAGTLSGSEDLKGMGDIENSVTTTLHAGTQLGGAVHFSVDANLALSHRENGNLYNFGLSAPLFQSSTDSIELSGTASYGDRKYNQTNFGVTATQSANSGYSSFAPKAGFTQAMAMVSWGHVINKHWSVRTAVGATHMLGDAANSPLTKKKTSPILVSTVNYAF
ncbi:MAG: MipA/OmpV family protein [Burkholderiales bacterium]|nr:MipA/OmpV family protein [Burkholderiales bacterium]